MGAETNPTERCQGGIFLASMRPRHDGRGNDGSTSRERVEHRASMRPRHDGRGNALNMPKPMPPGMLQ